MAVTRYGETRFAATHDGRLLVGIMAGDHASLERFYDHWADVVYRYACLLTGDRTQAEDLALAVFTAVWRDPAALRERCECTLAGLLALTRQSHRR